MDLPSADTDNPGLGGFVSKFEEFYRRAGLVLTSVDVLLSRPDVNLKRIGFVGHSFGATWGGVLAGVEKRIKAYVLMAGLPDIADFNKTGAPLYDQMSERVRKQFGEEKIKNYVAIISAISPARFIGQAAPAVVFMQFAEKDDFISATTAKHSFDAASEPKQERWYYSAHELNDPKALVDRIHWFQEYPFGSVGLNTELYEKDELRGTGRFPGHHDISRKT